MALVFKKLEMHGFKSFAKKVVFEFPGSVTAIVGPNGSGKSNVVEAIRFVLGEQSAKSLRSKTGADLIFKGSAKIPHMNRASVTITFDNTKRIFQLPGLTETGGPNLDFDEVTISREVVADGGQVYRINDTEVRMKDIHELIAGVNIGTSGHHIISQGEADRLLNAKPVERREMLEESLGLRLYHYRIREAERKLEKTKTHIEQAESLRRELAPHIKFLKKQVEKIEGAQVLRHELEQLYRNYLSHEGSFCKYALQRIHGRMGIVHADIQTQNISLQNLPSDHEYQDSVRIREQHIAGLRNDLRNLVNRQADIIRSQSRAEGMLEIIDTPTPVSVTNSISREQLEASLHQILSEIRNISWSHITDISGHIYELFQNWKQGLWEQSSPSSESSSKRNEILSNIATGQAELVQIENQIKNLEQTLHIETEKLDTLHHNFRDQEMTRRTLSESKHTLQREMDQLQHEETLIKDRIVELESEYVDAIACIGAHMVNIKSEIISETEILSAIDLRSLHTQIHRNKIKLEESGVSGGTEVISEYEEAIARDNHLAGEIIDITKTFNDLTETITQLQEKLSTDFISGLSRINTEFKKYFELMFGGGYASLSLVTIDKKKKKTTDESGELLEEIDGENDDKETGVDIDVSLPRKKVKDLDMLSGGERSLTSIALLFALSQVNPPPFLVLDETDAALDEANSRKYGDMIERLARETQLVVVTHNRETMSRANILFGVTLGSDDASTVLSVSFDEAGQYAK